MAMRRQFKLATFLKLAFVVSILIFILPTFLAAFQLRAIKDCGRFKCRSNLRQLATAMALYVDSRGRGSAYAPYSGAEFWTHMYRTEVMLDSEIYLCPHTNDDNHNGNDLNGAGKPPPTACSYAGRINTPGNPFRIFTSRNAADTPIGCDDNEGDPNHEEVVTVVFLDVSAKEFLLKDPLLGGSRLGKGILEVCAN